MSTPENETPKIVGSETAPNPHRAAGVGYGNSVTHTLWLRKLRNPQAWVPESRNPRLWVPGKPEPTRCGFRESRNPRRGFRELEPTRGHQAELADGPRFVVF